jgi:hypothetical protein
MSLLQSGGKFVLNSHLVCVWLLEICCIEKSHILKVESFLLVYLHLVLGIWLLKWLSSYFLMWKKSRSEKFIDYGRPWICVKWEVIFFVKLDLWGWPCISLLTCGFICLYCCCLFFYLVCKFFSPALILVDLSTWFYAFSLGWELKKAIWIAVHMTFLWCFNMWVSEVQHVWLLFFIWRTKWQLLLVR